MTKIIDGCKIANKILKENARLIKRLKVAKISPKLTVVMVGDNGPSQIYVRKKGEAAKAIGLGFKLIRLPSTITRELLLQKILDIQKNDNPDGLIIQLPLPEHLYQPNILNAINPDIDVDCLTEINLGKIVRRNHFLLPPTPSAILAILQSLRINPIGKNVTIIGTGPLVGKPLAIMLMNQGATITSCNKETKNLKDKCLDADILISAVGKQNLVRGDMVKPGAIVIDAGVTYEKQKIYGDINIKEVAVRAGRYTPTPGGVGPITVALLLRNTLLCAQQRHQSKKL